MGKDDMSKGGKKN